MKHTTSISSSCCDIQGNLFLRNQIQMVFLAKNDRQSPQDYAIPPGTTLKEECSRAFRIASAAWQIFSDCFKREDLTEKNRLEKTRQFARSFFVYGLGYGKIVELDGINIDERCYPVTFLADDVPVAIVAAPHSLDENRSELAVEGSTSKKSAFQLIQEALNASEDYRWGFAFNGCAVRLVRDAMSLTRPSYLEFNLREIFEAQDYAEFIHLWLSLHSSRATVKDGYTAWDLWIKAGEEAGQPARDALSANIKQAICTLGEGFIAEPSNHELREQLASGKLTVKQYTHELLRLMYRFLFIFCLEERDLLNLKEETEENRLAIERYHNGYALHRFRDIATKNRFRNRFKDAYASVKIVFNALCEGLPELALPGLGGLFRKDQCPNLMAAALSNNYFFQAMEFMRWGTFNGVRSVIDYRNMGTEELGSIYESLLELIPSVDLNSRTFGFIGQLTVASERKKTASYYTPEPFVQSLIKTALDPIIEKRLSENPSTPETALLSLRVIDPACGSGHFLLAAARRIAEHLALVRSPGGVVLPPVYRTALREVIQHCIYGVDLNPLAIELARMALWLEGYAEGCPLSFLDHHLKVGNSVVGVFDLQTLKNGISADAYKPAGGDDKTICNALKNINKSELKSLSKALETYSGKNDLLMSQNENTLLQSLESMQSVSLTDEEKKASVYARYQQLLESSSSRMACNAFVGAFLAPKTEQSKELIPTSGTLGRILIDPDNLSTADMAAVAFAEKICQSASVFNWPLEFPLVFAQGGFDCVLGNPPWEKAKVEDKVWFANRYPAIAQAKTDKRKKMIDALAKGQLASLLTGIPAFADVRSSEQELFEQYQNAQHRAASAANLCHLNEEEGGRFPMTGTGDTNLYAYFCELAVSLRKEDGTVGLVVPAGIITDDASQTFSRYALAGRAKSIYHFNNTEQLFPIDGRYTFLLLTLAPSDRLDCVFYATKMIHLDDADRHVEFKKGDLELFNPNTRTCVLARTQRDIDLCRKIYHSSSVLVKEKTDIEKEVNPWGIRFLRMFDMSTDSFLFHENKDDDNLVPLYEGKLFHQFDHRWASYKGSTDSKGDPVPDDCTPTEKKIFNFEITPRYWISKNDVESRISGKNKSAFWEKPWALTLRKITRTTDERTAICSVLPSSWGQGDSATYLYPTKASPSQAACLLADINSLIVDFVCRIKQSGANLNYFIIKQLPILPPDIYSEKDIAFIASRVAKLTRTSKSVADVWLTEYPAETFQSPEERLRIQAELDAYYARLYGLTREDLQYILAPSTVMGDEFPSVTFPGLKRNEINEFGEYLTQRLVLEAFDKLEAGTIQ